MLWDPSHCCLLGRRQIGAALTTPTTARSTTLAADALWEHSRCFFLGRSHRRFGWRGFQLFCAQPVICRYLILQSIRTLSDERFESREFLRAIRWIGEEH